MLNLLVSYLSWLQIMFLWQSRINLIYSCNQVFLRISHARSLSNIPIMATDYVSLTSQRAIHLLSYKILELSLR